MLTLVTSVRGLLSPTVPAEAEETEEKGLGEMPGEKDENEEKAEKGDASPVTVAVVVVVLPLRSFRFRFFFPPSRLPSPSCVGAVGGRGGFDAEDRAPDDRAAEDRAAEGTESLVVVW